MRALLLRLSVALACAALVMPARAQDKGLPPTEDQPAQQDKVKQPPPPPVKDLDRAAPAPDKAPPDQPAQDRAAQPPAQNQNQQNQGAQVDVNVQRLSGKVVSTDNNQVVLRTDAGREVTLFPSTQTRFMIDGRAARFADFRVGSVVDAAYVVDRDRFVLNSLAVGQAAAPAAPAPAPAANIPAPPAQPQGTLVEGTVVKVVGNDQIVIKTSDGKEITIHVTPQTKYTLTEQGGAFVDLAPNMPVRAYYNVIDRRPTARSILRWRR